MKKLLILAILLFPSIVLATPVSVDRLNNERIEPLIKTDFFQAPYLKATSTVATSTFNGGVVFDGTGTSAFNWDKDGLEIIHNSDGCNDVPFRIGMDGGGFQVFRVDGCGIDVIGDIIATFGSISSDSQVSAPTILGNSISTTDGKAQLFNGGSVEFASTQFVIDTLGRITALASGTSTWSSMNHAFRSASTTATSTLAGLNVITGCVAVRGTCLGTGNVTGTGVANQVTYWTGTNSQAGDAGLTYNASTDLLTATNASTTLASISEALVGGLSIKGFQTRSDVGFFSSPAEGPLWISPEFDIKNASGVYQLRTESMFGQIFPIFCYGRDASDSSGPICLKFNATNKAFFFGTYFDVDDGISFESTNIYSGNDFVADAANDGGGSYSAGTSNSRLYSIQYTFNGDADTGLKQCNLGKLDFNTYKTDCLSLITGNTEVLSLDTASTTLKRGNFGIGTTSPYAKLSVVGPVVAEYFHATSTTATSTFANAIYVGTSTPNAGLANSSLLVSSRLPGLTALTVQGIVGQTANIFRVRKDDSTSFFSIDSSGTANFYQQAQFTGPTFAQVQVSTAGVPLDFKTVAGTGDITLTPGNALAATFHDTGTTTLVGALDLNQTTKPIVGNATLVGGTVTVTTGAATANSYLLTTRKTSGGTIGTAITYTVTNGSFTITSDSVLDTSTFTWLLIQ